MTDGKVTAEVTEVTKSKPHHSFWGQFHFHRRDDPMKFLSLVISFGSLCIAISGFVYVTVQIHNLHDALDFQSYNSINGQMTNIDMLFVNNPELRPYFFENQPLPKDNLPLRNKILAAAELQLDFIDYWFVEARHLELDEYDTQSWRRYFDNFFVSSRVMCEVLRSERGEYGDELLSIAYESKHCPGVAPRDSAAIRWLDKYFPKRKLFYPLRWY